MNSNLHPYREMGDGVYEALWKLALAMFFKAIITVFTFGIKVSAVRLSVLVHVLGLVSSLQQQN